MNINRIMMIKKKTNQLERLKIREKKYKKNKKIPKEFNRN